MSLLLDLIFGTPQLAVVLSLVFKLLRALTQGYKKLQNRMFDYLDRFLTCEGQQSGWENDMANFVAEIFNDNRELCIKIKPDQVIFSVLLINS